MPKIGLRNEFKRKGKSRLLATLADYANLVYLSISHASLAQGESNNPIKIRVLNSGLIWILHHSSNSQIIEMIPEIKLAIMKLLIHSWEERLTCFDCNDKTWAELASRHAQSGRANFEDIGNAKGRERSAEVWLVIWQLSCR